MQLHAVSKRLAGAAFLLLAAAAPAAAADPAPANAATAATPQVPGHATKPGVDEPKKICRTIQQINSRLKGSRVCLTREQWRNAKYN